MLTKLLEAQRTQTAARSKSEVNDQVDAMWPEKQKSQTNTCRYCGSTHPPQRYPAHGKRCRECAKMSHMNAVCRSTIQIIHELEQ